MRFGGFVETKPWFWETKGPRASPQASGHASQTLQKQTRLWMLLLVLQPPRESRFPFPSFDRFSFWLFRRDETAVFGKTRPPRASTGPSKSEVALLSHLRAPRGLPRHPKHTCFHVSGRNGVLILHVFSAFHVSGRLGVVISHVF